jgi:hypothetical protein
LHCSRPRGQLPILGEYCSINEYFRHVISFRFVLDGSIVRLCGLKFCPVAP